LIVKAELLSERKMSGVLDEATQLCRILGKSIATAKRAKQRKNPSEAIRAMAVSIDQFAMTNFQ